MYSNFRVCVTLALLYYIENDFGIKRRINPIYSYISGSVFILFLKKILSKVAHIKTIIKNHLEKQIQSI
jgi:hypothetical protein